MVNNELFFFFSLQERSGSEAHQKIKTDFYLTIKPASRVRQIIFRYLLQDLSKKCSLVPCHHNSRQTTTLKLLLLLVHLLLHRGRISVCIKEEDAKKGVVDEQSNKCGVPLLQLIVLSEILR